MSNEIESYIVLKPIAERFSRVASEITDADIKQMIMLVMRERIERVVNFDEVSKVIDEYVTEHTEEIAQAVMDSLSKRLELPSGYKFY
jgi:hypothetical protein